MVCVSLSCLLCDFVLNSFHVEDLMSSSHDILCLESQEIMTIVGM